MSTPRRSTLSRCLVLIVVLAAGCYNRVVQGDETVYSFAGWVGALVILGGLVAFPVGLLISQRSWRGYIIVVGGPLIALLVGPSMYTDRVKVDEQHFECRYGFWWSPSIFNIRFDDLRHIEWETEVKTSRRGGQEYNYFLLCVYKDGRRDKVAVGTLMRQAVEEILQRARERSVPILFPKD